MSYRAGDLKWRYIQLPRTRVIRRLYDFRKRFLSPLGFLCCSFFLTSFRTQSKRQVNSWRMTEVISCLFLFFPGWLWCMRFWSLRLEVCIADVSSPFVLTPSFTKLGGQELIKTIKFCSDQYQSSSLFGCLPRSLCEVTVHCQSR